VAEPLGGLDWHDLVEPVHWDQVPADVPELLELLPRADLYVEHEVDIRLHPTLTRCWSRQGKAGQRLVRAPGQSSKIVDLSAIDWRDGWVSYGFVAARTADAYCSQLTHLVTRSQQRGRIALVVADNLGIHTPARSKKLRELLATQGDYLRLVYTPAYDPEANPIERFWKPFRHRVTHNHRRSNLYDLHLDASEHFLTRDNDPNLDLREIGSPLAREDQTAA
jgi:transposase